VLLQIIIEVEVIEVVNGNEALHLLHSVEKHENSE
jgi:hypothetical protein